MNYLVLCGVVLVTACSLPAHLFACSQTKRTVVSLETDCKQDLTKQTKQERKQELEQVANKLIEAIRKKDRAVLLQMISKNGLHFEVHGKISFDDIKESFAKKSGLYCAFFDSVCWQKLNKEVGNENTFYSFHEVFGRDPNLRMLISFPESSEVSCHASVLVEWKGKPRWSFPEIFFFDYENSSWMLSGFDLFLSDEYEQFVPSDDSHLLE